MDQFASHFPTEFAYETFTLKKWQGLYSTLSYWEFLVTLLKYYYTYAIKTVYTQ